VISLVTSPSEGEVPTCFLDKLRTDPDEAIAPVVRRLALAVIGLLYLAFDAKRVRELVIEHHRI
jgi:hypothetical protein